MLAGLGSSRSRENISELKRIGGIDEQFADDLYFWTISDFCCDDENNFYVADSGWRKIFKFNAAGNFLGSFGREGQGPGEFLGRPSLSISFGNDRHIYVSDPGANRISIFTKDGAFVRRWPTQPYLYDKATADSKGDVYLLEPGHEKAISVLDREFKIKDRFLDRSRIFRYRISPPPKGHSNHVRLTHHDVAKLLTREDHLIVVSNRSLRVFHYDPKHELVGEFDIGNNEFEKDFRGRLKAAEKEGAFILPFHACLDESENIVLAYFNGSLGNWELYRYRSGGTYLDSIRFPDKHASGKICFDRLGKIYRRIRTDDGEEIAIYRIQ